MNSFFQKMTTKCGSSYLTYYSNFFGNFSSDITEFKGTSFVTKSLTINEANSLNGVTWKGEFILKFTSSRTNHDKYGWGDWHSYSTDYNPPLIIYIEKSNDIWTWKGRSDFGVFSAIDLAQFNKPSCNTLLQGKEKPVTTCVFNCSP